MTLIESIAARENAWKLEELATLLNFSKGKLYKMVNSGRIPHIRIDGSVRFDPKVVSEWVKNQTI